MCDYWIKVEGKPKLYHVNMLKKYLSRAEEDKPVCTVSTAAVIGEVEEWEESARVIEDIPLIPLQATETIEDINLDPRCPEILC